MLIDADQNKGKVIIEIVVTERTDCLKNFVELFFGFLVFDIGTLAELLFKEFVCFGFDDDWVGLLISK